MPYTGPVLSDKEEREEIAFARKQAEKRWREMKIQQEADYKIKHPHIDKIKTGAKVVAGAAAIGGAAYGGYRLHKYIAKKRGKK
jgi:hypothetical protein